MCLPINIQSPCTNWAVGIVVVCISVQVDPEAEYGYVGSARCREIGRAVVSCILEPTRTEGNELKDD